MNGKSFAVMLLLSAISQSLLLPDAARASDATFSFACVADVQYDPAKKPSAGRRYSESLAKLECVVKELNEAKPDFVVDLGDLTDGEPKAAVAVLEVYAKLKPKLYHVAGNHDLWKQGEALVKDKYGMPSLNYSFVHKGWRFVVVDSLDVSGYSDSAEKRAEAKAMRSIDKKLRPFDGAVSSANLAWLDAELAAAEKSGERVIVLSHVPAAPEAAATNVSIWNSAAIKGLLRKRPGVVALWLSGHHHPGGYAEIDGVRHVTVQALCNAPENGTAYALVDVKPDAVAVRGFGSVPSRSFPLAKRSVACGGSISARVLSPDGTPLSGVFAMSDDGRFASSDAAGRFTFEGVIPGKYAIKLIHPDFAASTVSCSPAKEGDAARVEARLLKADEPRGVVYGSLKDASGAALPGWLELRDADGPIRFFDADGTSYGGRLDVPKGVWHEKNRRFWTRGDFVFQAKPGVLRGSVFAEGYEPREVSLDVKAGAATPLELVLRKIASPAERGWFKGEFHGHAVHGEKLYRINIPFAANILRCEGYRWCYLSSSFNNDDLLVDNAKLARLESGASLFLRLNSEYPKTKGGHVGNVGVEPPGKPLPYPKHSNIETIKSEIVDKGGAAVPVHPLYSHMRSRELPFDLLGASELISGFDFYTSWNPKWEELWRTFLDKGYKLCRTATSDAAFDLGRTPGTMGATYVKPASGVLDDASIVEAMRAGRTAIGWGGAMLVFEIDGASCGEEFPADGKARKAKLRVYALPSSKLEVEVARNGEPFKSFQVAIPESGEADFDFDISEGSKAWYSALCSQSGAKGRLLAASSPFYFGDWTRPASVLAKIAVRVFDAASKEPLDAKLELLDGGKTRHAVEAKNGSARLEARVFERVRASAEGYAPIELGVLSSKNIADFIESSTEADLADWSHYEKARAELGRCVMEFPLKRR